MKAMEEREVKKDDLQQNQIENLRQLLKKEVEEKDRQSENSAELEARTKLILKELQELKNRVAEKSRELQEKEKIIKDKDAKIGEYLAKITDLQKSKHVLSFRVTEMRKSLEPKEAQIEKLKEELEKLENEFEVMLISMQKHTEKNEAIIKINETLEEAIRRQVATTRAKEQQINKMTMDIYGCVKGEDSKKALDNLKRLYMSYV